MAVNPVLRCLHALFGEQLEHDRGPERGYGLSRMACPGGHEGGDAVGGAGMHGAVRIDAEVLCDFGMNPAQGGARLHDLWQQVGMRQLQYPVRPAQCFNVVAGLQRVVVVAVAAQAGKQCGEPIGLVHEVACSCGVRMPCQPQELGQP